MALKLSQRCPRIISKLSQSTPKFVNRVEICRDHRDRRSCKIRASCVNLKKKHVFLQNMLSIRFTGKFCNFTSNFTPSLQFFIDIEAFTLSLLCKHNFLKILARKSGGVYFYKFYVWLQRCNTLGKTWKLTKNYENTLKKSIPPITVKNHETTMKNHEWH